MLAYYAQRKEDISEEKNKGQLLAHIADERREMRKYCERSPLRFLSREPDEASVDKIFSDLITFRQELTIFHYSGHASMSQIFLNNAGGNAETLALLLGQCPNLRLVFMNGCCTKGHVYHLFKNKVPFVIATNYEVRDALAYKFAAKFYETLFVNQRTGPETFKVAFGHALNLITLGDDTSVVLNRYVPDAKTLVNPLSDLSNTVRGGLDTSGDTETDLPVWGFHVFNENDPRINGAWLPAIRRKTDLSRAFTCGRDALSDIFRKHWAIQSKQKKVLHYFQMDENRKSMEGLSIKLLFENITRNLSISDGVPYHFPNDPNQRNFRDRSIRLYAENASKDEIIHKIHEGILGFANDPSNQIHESFGDLYKIGLIQRKKLIFLFINVRKDDFEQLQMPIIDFIKESIEVDRSSTDLTRPLLLLFWHVETPKDSMLSLISSFRRKTATSLIKSFNDYVCVVHETEFKPIPIPNLDELQDWINFNEQPYERLPELEQLITKYQNVMTLENRLKDLLEKVDN
jgi:hypothetical protein